MIVQQVSSNQAAAISRMHVAIRVLIHNDSMLRQPTDKSFNDSDYCSAGSDAYGAKHVFVLDDNLHILSSN